MDSRSRDSKIPLNIGLRGRTTIDLAVVVNEGKVLTLTSGESGGHERGFATSRGQGSVSCFVRFDATYGADPQFCAVWRHVNESLTVSLAEVLCTGAGRGTQPKARLPDGPHQGQAYTLHPVGNATSKSIVDGYKV